MIKVMPIMELECGERTCASRSPTNGFRLCKWYRAYGGRAVLGRCDLFDRNDLRKRQVGEYHFGMRCEECRTAERVFLQVQQDTTAFAIQLHETMREGLTSLTEAQERLGQVALTKGG